MFQVSRSSASMVGPPDCWNHEATITVNRHLRLGASVAEAMCALLGCPQISSSTSQEQATFRLLGCMDQSSPAQPLGTHNEVRCLASSHFQIARVYGPEQPSTACGDLRGTMPQFF